MNNIEELVLCDQYITTPEILIEILIQNRKINFL